MSNLKVHPTAIIEDGAQIGEGVSIGPYCMVGPRVKLGDNVKLHSHVVVEGNTTIGEGTEIFPFASIGHVTQDLKFSGEDSALVIGKNNKIREYVTMQGGTSGDRLTTTVGDNCLFMASSHVAHDCVVGNNVIMANNATLAGHVTVGDFAILGGLCAVHQFVRIGHHCIIAGLSAVAYDVIPYGLVKGVRAGLSGINLVGLRRRNFAREDINAMNQAYKDLFESEGNFVDKVARAKETHQDNSHAMEIIDFVGSNDGRSITTPLDLTAA